MNAPVQIASAKRMGFLEATQAANAWRGACIGKLAEAEQRVSELLVLAGERFEYAALKPPFPHLVGQRYERLRKLLAIPGPIAAHASSLTPALERLSAFDDLRNQLCHAHLDVVRTQPGEFLYLLRMIALTKQVAAKRTTAYTPGEASHLLTEISSAVDGFVRKLAPTVKVLAA